MVSNGGESTDEGRNGSAGKGYYVKGSGLDGFSVWK